MKPKTKGKYTPNLDAFSNRKDVVYVITRFNAIEGRLAEILIKEIGAPEEKQAFLRDILFNSAILPFAAKVKLYGAARALLYPIQAREPFGLVLAEAMACGTPVAALDRGAVREVVDNGVTGMIFSDLEQMTNELPRVFDLDRRKVRERAVARFGAGRMVDEYLAVYTRIVEAHRARR